MLKKCGMTNAYETDSPIDCNVDLETTKSKDHADDHDSTTNQKQYLAIVGSLIYTALGARPDISYVVTLLSRFNMDPRTRHLTAAKRALRYPR